MLAPWLTNRWLTHAKGGSTRMPTCVNCHQPDAQFRADDSRLYCNEFCAEGGPQAQERRI
jgi:hypothetical protein